MPNKAQFVDMLAERLDGDRKRAAAALEAVIDSVYAAISRGERVAISGFGVFERRERAARTARNPATGAAVKVAASRVPAFRPGAEFRAYANGAREIVQDRTARTQAAVTKAADAVREAPAKAAAKVKDAADAVRGQGKAAKKAAKKSAPAKKSAAKKSAPAKKAAKKSAPAKKTAAAKKSAPAKKSAAKKAPAKKTAAKKAPVKKAAKKAPAKKK